MKKVKGSLAVLVLALALVLSTFAFSACGDKNSNVAVSGIELNAQSIDIQADEVFQLTATVKPENATNKNVTWESDAPDIATVDQTGKVTGVKLGFATVFAVTEDGEFEAECGVNVVPPIGAEVLKLVVDGGVNDGITATFYAKGIVEISDFTADIGIAALPAKSFRANWSVAEGSVTVQEAIANVEAFGNVIPYPMSFRFSNDKAKLQMYTVLEDKSEVVLCEFPITDEQYAKLVSDYEEATFAVESVALDQEQMSMYATELKILIATIMPAYASNKNVTWKSDNIAVATVDGGIVTAVAEGTANITVTTVDGGFTATCQITVNSKVDVTGVTIAETLALSFGNNGVGQKGSLTAQIAPAGATNQNVTWRSSDEAVATVSATGEVTAKKAGSATITATTVDGGFTADCAVTVSSALLVKYSETGISSIIFSENNVTVSAMQMSGMTVINATGSTSWSIESDEFTIADITTAGSIMDMLSGNSVIKLDLAAADSANATSFLGGTLKFTVTEGAENSKSIKITFEYTQPADGEKPADIEIITFTLTAQEFAFLTPSAS